MLPYPRWSKWKEWARAWSGMRRPKVLILSSSFLPTIGGAQYQLKWFLDCLDRLSPSERNVQVHFAYPDKASREFAQFNNISTHDLQLHDQRLSTVARMIARLGRLLQSIRPGHCALSWCTSNSGMGRTGMSGFQCQDEDYRDLARRRHRQTARMVVWQAQFPAL